MSQCKKNIIIYLLLILISRFIAAQNLEEYIGIATENNPSLKAKYLEYQAHLEKISQVGLPDPSISLGYFVLPVETRLGGQRLKISLKQTFPWFGTLGGEKEVISLESLVKLYQWEDLKNILFYEIKITLFELLRLKKDEAIIKDNIDILHSYERLSLQKYQHNLSKLSDVLQVQIQKREEENRLKELQDLRKILTIRFNTFLNRSLNEPVEVSDTSIKNFILSDISLISDKIKNNPTLKILEINEKILVAEKKIITYQYKPHLGLGLDYLFVSPRTDSDPQHNGRDIFMPNINITIPFFGKKNYHANLSELKLHQEALIQKKEQTKNQLLAQLWKGWEEYQGVERNINLYKKQITEVQRIINLLLKDYSTTSKNFEEVLDMQQRLLKYYTMLHQAQQDKQVAIAYLEMLYLNR